MRELSVAERRYLVVLAVIEDGLSVTEAAAKVGVSRQTLHAWLSRYAGSGLEGLAGRSHRPHRCPHQMCGLVEVRLTELRMLHPGWGAARLGHRLGREGLDPVPSVAAIGRALRRLGPAATIDARWLSSGRGSGSSLLTSQVCDCPQLHRDDTGVRRSKVSHERDACCIGGRGFKAPQLHWQLSLQQPHPMG